MRAWIEPNDDPTPILTINEYENDILQKSTNILHRPLPWHYENIPPFDYTE